MRHVVLARINSAQAFGQVQGLIHRRDNHNLETSFSGGDCKYEFHHAVLWAGRTQGGSPMSDILRLLPGIPIDVCSSKCQFHVIDFMLQGNGNQEIPFKPRLMYKHFVTGNGFSFEPTSLQNSGLIDAVAVTHGQQAELFLALLAALPRMRRSRPAISNFYSVLPPSLQIQIVGTNVVLTCPVSANRVTFFKRPPIWRSPQSWTICDQCAFDYRFPIYVYKPDVRGHPFLSLEPNRN